MTDSYLAAADVEALARMLNALLVEHWILYDRVAVLEELLAQRGAIEVGSLETYRPSADFSVRLEALRNTVFANVLGAADGGERRSVDELRRRQP
ncbi:MAG: hypothetical protein WD448_03240 [Woeseia sp.]